MEQVAPAGDVYQAGTLSGNPLAVAAGLATLAELDAAAYARLGELTDRLAAGLAAAAAGAGGDEGPRASVTSRPGLVTLFMAPEAPHDFASAKASDLDAYARFCRAMLERGVYPPPSQFEAWFVSLAHDEEAIDRTCEAAAEALREAWA
jgi:glutamate-1-semialdehyde 2,1-aminomutase